MPAAATDAVPETKPRHFFAVLRELAELAGRPDLQQEAFEAAGRDFSSQQNWFRLRDELGKDAARQELVRQLRWAADRVEAARDPDVFGCKIVEAGWERQGPMCSVCVTLSYPWGG